ncbi:hypothetical protein COV93_06940 [Candidatus Woesearchaeota archaeon CG11_big_fil_rev_8_21_14_0_20_43_8]|nr:MAG: hypothetical protein COV93_06940 [Candidatus Woesearchaeota archaeon CG11_big_fil_rev_8_21_14_0_20_43_8]
MLVAISQRNDLNQHSDLIDNLENSYIDYLRKFGINPLILPNIPESIGYYFTDYSISHVILSGGNDIDPVLYGEVNKGNLSVSKRRDQTEKKIIDIAKEKHIPVLGICRGMHFINTYFDGKLTDKLFSGASIHSHHVKKDHDVLVLSKEIIARLGRQIKVNSYHGFGISQNLLSSELMPFCSSDDGLIEGFFHPVLPFAGIQWHPERHSPDDKINDFLIRNFIGRGLFWKK